MIIYIGFISKLVSHELGILLIWISRKKSEVKLETRK